MAAIFGFLYTGCTLAPPGEYEWTSICSSDAAFCQILWPLVNTMRNSGLCQVLSQTHTQLECGPMPNVMVALPNIGGALCSTPQSLADAHTWLPCSNAAKTRRLLKLAGVPQTNQTVLYPYRCTDGVKFGTEEGQRSPIISIGIYFTAIK